LSVVREDVERTPGRVAFRSWRIGNTQSNLLDLDQESGPWVVRFQALIKEEIRKGIIVVLLRSAENTILWSGMYSELQIKPGPWEFCLSFAKLPLNPGIYTWETRFFDDHQWFERLQVPDLSILSEMDVDILGYLKGPLNLNVKFDLVEQVETGMEQSEA
jgi:hypothetical protein